jgi:spermidine/putrescine transport system ATP-binding protein
MAERAAVALGLHGLRRTYGETVAVDRLDAEIVDGEFFSLIGPSGCGKTTTLRMIAGLVAPTEGRIEVHGRDITDLRAHKRPVNTVFQQYALFPHMSVFDNVAFGLRERRVSRRETAKRVGEMLELVDLTGRGGARPSELSGGQQQRVALARSLVLRPELLLLDEPLGALDLKLRKQLQLELKRIQHEVGITFIYVTHDQEEAFAMSDRVAIMHRGLVEQLGTPRDVYQRPATEFVADFVGASNRLPGMVATSSPQGGYEVELEGIGRAPSRGVPGIEPGTPVLAIVRPEAIEPAAAQAGWTTMRGRVTDVSYLGPHATCQVTGPNGLPPLTMNVRAGTVDRGLGEGDEIEVGWHHDSLWLVPTGN